MRILPAGAVTSTLHHSQALTSFAPDKALQNLFVHNLGPGDAVGAAKRMRKMESSMTFLNNDNGGVKMPTVSPSTTAVRFPELLRPLLVGQD